MGEMEQPVTGAAGRRPDLVPDDAAPAAAVDAGCFDAAYFDTDGDGLLDTAVTSDGVDLVVLTDLDGDHVADQVLRIGPDGAVREAVPPSPGPGDGSGEGVADSGSGI